MGLTIKNTIDVSMDGVKCLVYGQSGVGKTTACATADNVLIISAESGLLSIKEKAVDYVEIASAEELMDVYVSIVSDKELEKYDCIALDSISEIAELILKEEMGKSKDGRKAYMEMQNKMLGIIRAFRDIKGRHVIFSAKEDRASDSNGGIYRQPSFPGSKTGPNSPYFFDEVFYLYAKTNEDGTKERIFLTDGDDTFMAKDRSGKLDYIENPDFQHVFNKILTKKEN